MTSAGSAHSAVNSPELERTQPATGDETEAEAGMESALRFLSHRSRTRFEVQRRLERDGLSREVVERVLGRLEETGLLDDDGYCAAFVRDRLALRPVSVRVLLEELYRRGISRERAGPIVQAVMAEEGVTEQDLLTAAALKKARALGRLPPATARRRLFDHLVRRGFPLDDVRPCVERVLDD